MLTINQIIILLDIYRGTETQKSIGTNFSDCMLLVKRNLVETGDDGKLKTTELGTKFIDKIKNLSIY